MRVHMILHLNNVQTILQCGFMRRYVSDYCWMESHCYREVVTQLVRKGKCLYAHHWSTWLSEEYCWLWLSQEKNECPQTYSTPQTFSNDSVLIPLGQVRVWKISKWDWNFMRIVTAWLHVFIICQSSTWLAQISRNITFSFCCSLRNSIF